MGTTSRFLISKIDPTVDRLYRDERLSMVFLMAIPTLNTPNYVLIGRSPLPIVQVYSFNIGTGRCHFVPLSELTPFAKPFGGEKTAHPGIIV